VGFPVNHLWQFHGIISQIRKFLATLDHELLFPYYLTSIKVNMDPNIVMPGVILQRRIMGRVDGQSMLLDHAGKEADEMHRHTAARPLLN
jgi:hypothetical protein